jgi:hypothetical protein
MVWKVATMVGNCLDKLKKDVENFKSEKSGSFETSDKDEKKEFDQVFT